MKDIKLCEKNWRILFDIKLNKKLKSMDEVISYLIELKGGKNK